MENLSGLPKRNPFVLMTYALAIVGMFAFIGWVVWPYSDAVAQLAVSPASAGSAVVPAVGITASPRAVIQPPHQLESQRRALELSLPDLSPAAGEATTHHRVARPIVGHSGWIELDGNVERQINDAWKHFAGQGLASKLDVIDGQRVVAVYHRYDATRNRVLMTLGYPQPEGRATPARFERVMLEAGHYQTWAGASVLEIWADPRQQPHLRFGTDTEHYQLDRHFNVISQTAYVGVR